MNNEALNQFITLLTNSFKDGKDFVLAQAPEVVKQILTFNLIESSVTLILCLVTFVGLWKWHKKIEKDWDQVGYLPLGIVAIVAFVFFCCATDNFLQIIFVPKLYLIAYMSNLVKGCGK